MKKIGDIMMEMGFRKDAPESVKEAFIKNLIKNATGLEIETPSERKNAGPAQPVKNEAHEAPSPPTQMVFEFIQDQGLKRPKVS